MSEAHCSLCGATISAPASWMQEYRANFTLTVPGLTHDVPAWGYPFHAACWDLLLVTKNPYTGSFSERHLFNIFLSCNAERGLIDLGHEYGGLAYRFPELSELLPGEEQRLILSGTKTEYSENPVNIDKLAEILEECSAQPVVTDVCCVRGHEFGVRDPFSTLPLELLESILQLLPSQYILNFKLASRIAASTPLSASFWRSRFALGFEYEHIFEARQQSQRGLNWRHLYFSLRPLGNLPALMNRKRIWNLATLLRHLVETASSTPCYGKALQSLLEPKASNREHSAAEQWLTAERILIKSIDIFRTGACALRTTTITLPSQLYGICVSTVTIGHKSYIFGFRLLQVSGEDLFIGYIHPDREASVFFSPRQDILQPIHLSGFVLAMDYGGLRAISFITHTGQRSSWIGELKGIPKHHLISNRTEFLRVQARFDALKIVSVSAQNRNETGERFAVSSRSGLRQAFWLPDIPLDNLILNYNFSERHIRRLGAKKPFNVLIFGGESAQFLPHLTKLSVWIVDVDKIFGIEFTFKAEVEGSKKHILGRRDAYLDQSRTYSIADGPSDVVEEFDINGPGGERIVQVETQQDEHGYFKDLRLTTNFGRRRKFLEETIVQTAPFVPITVTGKEIVGFYAVLSTGVVIEMLGVISTPSLGIDTSEHA